MADITLNGDDGEELHIADQTRASEAAASSAQDIPTRADNPIQSGALLEDRVDHPPTPLDMPCLVGKRGMLHSCDGLRRKRKIGELYLLGFLANGAKFHEFMVSDFFMSNIGQSIYLEDEDVTNIIAAIKNGILPRDQDNIRLLKDALIWMYKQDDKHERLLFYQRRWRLE